MAFDIVSSKIILSFFLSLTHEFVTQYKNNPNMIQYAGYPDDPTLPYRYSTYDTDTNFGDQPPMPTSSS
jgi:hypothetical protein